MNRRTARKIAGHIPEIVLSIVQGLFILWLIVDPRILSEWVRFLTVLGIICMLFLVPLFAGVCLIALSIILFQKAFEEEEEAEG